MFVSVVATIIIYFLGLGHNPSTEFGAIFSAWIGGVALFAVVGAAVSIVSLVRPEQESFDARARILFRRQTGRHIDYIVERIKDILEHYSEEANIKISIQSYDNNECKYKVLVTTSIVVRSYLDDVSTTYATDVHYSEATPSPTGGDPNRLIYVRVDGAPIGRTEDFDISGSLRRPLSTTIDMDQAARVEYCVQFWVSANEEGISHFPRRYTQNLRLEVENLINIDHSLKLSLIKNEGTEPDIIYLGQGECRALLEEADIKPNSRAYELRIHES